MIEFPVGERLADVSPAASPGAHSLMGRSVRLEPPDADRDALELFQGTHEREKDPGQWTYMAYGPFDDATHMRTWMRGVEELRDPLFLVVYDRQISLPVGMVSFLNIASQHRCLELGNIWYTPAVRRTAINTETIYLMLCESFDGLGYRRVEWKCDALNQRSIAAALRLGFSFEGIFKQHYIIKGRNRDTAWFAMLDTDWPRIKANFETVLYDPDCEVSLRTLNSEIGRSDPIVCPASGKPNNEDV